MSSRSLRYFVFQTLLTFERGKQGRRHVEDLLDKGYQAAGFSAEDRRFGTFLTYGILRNWFRLSGLIRRFSAIAPEKLEHRVQLLLRIGLFQLFGMGGIPDYAAVSSTLELATELKISKKTRGFINAVLNTYIREGKPLPSEPDEVFPPWWAHRLASQYTLETVNHMALAYLSVPTLSLRINTLKTEVAAYHQQLREAGIPFEVSPHIPQIVRITAPQGNPQLLPGYPEGLFMVQDESSAQVAPFLDPQPGDTVLEFGAAPGTKTTHLAALMRNQGRIIALDSSEKRLQRLRENCHRLGVTIAEPIIAKGESYVAHLKARADKVLVDAPCSGTGTLGKHPEILLALDEEAFHTYPETQLALLESGLQALKAEGILVYSTCSIDPTENQEVVARFLNRHPDAVTLESDQLILPDALHDGFYLARFKKATD